MSSVEETVIKIQNGESLKNELYEGVYKFLYLICGKYAQYAAWKGYCIDDLMSVAWLGVECAVKSYDAEKGMMFVTYAAFYVKSAIRHFLGFGKQAAPTLSLDAPVKGTDKLTFADTVEDEQISGEFERVESCDYFDALYAEIDKLNNTHRDVIKRHYLNGETVSSIADSEGVSQNDIQRIKNKALRELKNNRVLKERYVHEVAYRHVGVTDFKTTWTSATEWAAVKVLEKDKTQAW